MDKETLSNYGWIVICVLVLAVMMALATPFGKFVGDGFKSTYEGLYNTMTKGLSVIQVTEEIQTDPVLNHKNIIPEGGTYYVNYNFDYDEWQDVYDQKLEAGEPFPTTQKGDRYTFGNYEYVYQYNFCDNCDAWPMYCGCDGFDINGWAVRCVNNVAEPGTLLCSINGISNITLSNCCFDSCTSLKNIIIYSSMKKIPDHSLTSCYNLENVDLSECKELTSIGVNAFCDCPNLKNITIPVSVNSINEGALGNCISLTNITFEGTKAQWNAISFGEYWNFDCPEITVTCTDGTITIPSTLQN